MSTPAVQRVPRHAPAYCVDHASADPVYREHHTPRIYNIESYISGPIILPNGDYFGNLYAIDPRPALVSDARTLTMFTLFAELIALQLESENERSATEAALLDERTTAELREQFIAVLGHDLRSPLAAVGATAEWLARRSSEPELVSIGTRLRATTRRMSRLIGDVLDFARGRLGTGIGVSLSPTDDLADSLRDVVAELRDANPGRVVLEQIAVDGCVYCDRGHIQQLLSNLLANALTYGSPDQPVRVVITVDAGELVISVSNDGAPIAPQDLEKLRAVLATGNQSAGRRAGVGTLHLLADRQGARRDVIRGFVGADGDLFCGTDSGG